MVHQRILAVVRFPILVLFSLHFPLATFDKERRMTGMAFLVKFLPVSKFRLRYFSEKITPNTIFVAGYMSLVALLRRPKTTNWAAKNRWEMNGGCFYSQSSPYLGISNTSSSWAKLSSSSVTRFTTKKWEKECVMQRKGLKIDLLFPRGRKQHFQRWMAFFLHPVMKLARNANRSPKSSMDYRAIAHPLVNYV